MKHLKLFEAFYDNQNRDKVTKQLKTKLDFLTGKKTDDEGKPFDNVWTGMNINSICYTKRRIIFYTK